MSNAYKGGGTPCSTGTAGPTNPPFTGPGSTFGPVTGVSQPLMVSPKDTCCSPSPTTCCGPGAAGNPPGGPGGGNRPGGGGGRFALG